MGRQRKSKIEKCPFKMRFKTLADGRRSIILDRYADGKHHYEYLQLYLLPESSEKATRENARIMRKANEIMMERAEALINAEAESMLPKSDGDVLFVDWIQTCYDNHKLRGARDLAGLNSFRVNVGKFRPGQLLKDVDRQFILDYIEWMRNEYRTKWGSQLKQKSMHSYATSLRTVLNEAARAGMIAVSPWNLLETTDKIKDPASQREYLTIDEVKSLVATPHFNECVRQAYLFSCFCGLRISDVRSLKWRDISTAGEQWSVTVVMTKTTTPITLPLSRQARRWLPSREHRTHLCLTACPIWAISV